MSDGNRQTVRIGRIVAPTVNAITCPDDLTRPGCQDGGALRGWDIDARMNHILEKLAPIAVILRRPIDFIGRYRAAEIKMVIDGWRPWDWI
jgi:hypothetical protein